jgi:hypothetical protein
VATMPEYAWAYSWAMLVGIVVIVGLDKLGVI